MGNDSINSNHIKYDLRIIFYGNTPQEIIQRFTENNEISNINNRYYLYPKYNWYMFFSIDNRRISSINDIENIIKNMVPNKNRLIFKKNVIVCFVQLNEAINILQNYQRKFFENNNIEDNMPYFIFNKNSLNINNQNNQNLWDLKILFNEEKEVINISAINQNLELYQTDFWYEDFSRLKIFRNFNNLEEIYRRLEHLKEYNGFEISINNNTEKLEIKFHLNQRPENEENMNLFNEEVLDDSSSDDEEKNTKSSKKNKNTKKCKKKKNTKKPY